MKYEEFINQKIHIGEEKGFKPLWIPDFLYDFQKFIVDKSIRMGRFAEFADTGLGKTPMQLVFGQNVVEKTNGNVLLLTPLAVSHQTLQEAEKFGIEAERSRTGKVTGKITVTNYQQLEKFDPADFVGLICDESSAIKAATGQTRLNVTRFAAKMKYRLFCTATPSPNDFVELGTTSEALGELQYMEMLDQFFRDTSNDKNPQWSTPKYELKGHAVDKFWKWVSTWAMAIKKPSDIGFDDERFILPQLVEKEHCLKVTTPADGMLFVEPARTLKEQRAERKKTLINRAEKTRDLCAEHDLSVVWAHYNYETDFLEKIIPDSINIQGSDSDDAKEEKFIAFSKGQVKTLIIKPKIGCWGLNWQHCNHTVFFPSHSFEQFYQGIRRFYRFGQTRPVYVDIVTTDGEHAVTENIKRKANDMERMFQMLIKYMNDPHLAKKTEKFNKKVQIPTWLK